jgi:Zn-dependent protease
MSGGGADTRDHQDDLPGYNVSLGRWFGIPARAHWSVLLVLVLLTQLLAQVELPTALQDRPHLEYWLLGVVTGAAFLAGLAAHELAHALVARRYGIQARRLTLWLLGGMSELDGEPDRPRADLAIAGIGPVVTLALAGSEALLTVPLGTDSAVGVVLTWSAVSNLIIGVFNLLPAAPLDGGRVLRAFVWWRTGDRHRAALVAARAGRLLGMGLMAFGLLNVLAGAFGGLWYAFIGWFLSSASRSEELIVDFGGLAKLTAEDLMRPVRVLAASWWSVATLRQLVEEQHLDQSTFPVIDLDGVAIGAVLRSDLGGTDAVPPDTRLRDVMRRRHGVPLVRRSTPALNVALQLRLGARAVVVVDDARRPIGAVEPEDLTRQTRVPRQEDLVHPDWYPEPGLPVPAQLNVDK